MPLKGTRTKSSAVKKDEQIIGTNDYSIVSKRSVEALYHADEPQFLQAFVGPFKRRAPLINRGYWLRMQAVDQVVRRFLEDVTQKQKVVINLGCGYDTLPFRSLHKYPGLCQKVRFVDVDYPQCVQKKLKLIRQSELFGNTLQDITKASFEEDSNLTSPDKSTSNSSSCQVMLRSDRYMAVGCDLRQLDGLEKLLVEELDIHECKVLFLAEVSITYMDVDAADTVISWAASFEDAQFCLLEQFLPAGPNHPFAKTMLEHFAKQTPLRVVHRYPKLEDQRLRFASRGWTSIEAQDLWQLWQTPTLLTEVDRLKLNDVEPFDEWEEFALFAGHYFLLAASTKASNSSVDHGEDRLMPRSKSLDDVGVTPKPKLLRIQNPEGCGLRRFGAVINSDGSSMGYHGGLDPVGRNSSCDIYNRTRSAETLDITGAPVEVLCHTITGLDSRGHAHLLAGGRASPAKPSPQCWLHRDGIWIRIHDLLPARYRHCAVRVSCKGEPGVLVFGGRTGDGTVLDRWDLWTQGSGWREIELSKKHPEARFGACLAVTGGNSGILFGGMSEGGIVLEDFWEWRLEDDDGVTVVFQDQTEKMRCTCHPSLYARFGAKLAWSCWGLLLIGGIATRVLQWFEEIMLVHPQIDLLQLETHPLKSQTGTRPLLVGIGAAPVGGPHGVDDVLIMGGGAVCFSFGAYWNGSCYLLTVGPNKDHGWQFQEQTPSTINNRSDIEDNRGHLSSAQYLENAKRSRDHNDSKSALSEIEAVTISTATASEGITAQPISRMPLRASKEFEDILASGRPVVLIGLGLGSCITLWTAAYLKDRIGHDRSVVIHSCSTKHMDFQAKNFTYLIQPFGCFLDDAMRGGHVYLRALASTQPAKHPASLQRDFPTIATDFCLPTALGAVKANEHSSVLRISGSVTMWLHYDVMANVYCQIRGKKRIVLFAPCDVKHLAFPAGSTTSNLNVFIENEPALKDLRPFEAVLSPGDVLFIPPCWPHATAPEGEEGGVAVNVFFRGLQSGYAAGRDVYGNRDLEAYQNGRRDIERIIKAFEAVHVEEGRAAIAALAEALLADGNGAINLKGRGSKEIERILKSVKELPEDIGRFYRDRLGQELMEKAQGLE